MFGETTADPAAVMAGKAAIPCYYCGDPIRYEGGGLTIGGDVVPGQGVPIAPYDYHLIVSVAGTEDKWDEYFDSYAQAGGFTEAKNPAGVRAFQGYKKQKAPGTNP
jgi:hypothetical protein